MMKKAVHILTLCRPVECILDSPRRNFQSKSPVRRRNPRSCPCDRPRLSQPGDKQHARFALLRWPIATHSQHARFALLRWPIAAHSEGPPMEGFLLYGAMGQGPPIRTALRRRDCICFVYQSLQPQLIACAASARDNRDLPLNLDSVP